MIVFRKLPLNLYCVLNLLTMNHQLLDSIRSDPCWQIQYELCFHSPLSVDHSLNWHLQNTSHQMDQRWTSISSPCIYTLSISFQALILLHLKFLLTETRQYNHTWLANNLIVVILILLFLLFSKWYISLTYAKCFPVSAPRWVLVVCCSRGSRA